MKCRVQLRYEIATEDHRRTVNKASIPPLARHVKRMLLRLDPAANTADLDVLMIAHAEEECKGVQPAISRGENCTLTRGRAA